MNERERFEEKWTEDPLSTASIAGSPLIVESYKEVALKYFQAGRADAMAWRPIESAPKDGTDWLGLTESGARVVCRRLDADSPYSINGAEFYEAWAHDPIYTLVAWMPLPEPQK